ncbi:hypothetical protein [Microbulbifer sp. JMSA008]|uniref:hypothetical protein n=1 Tax=Microbulbifer sp. JMSA008 TaxID=3243373 RepID=UPI004039581D
MKKIVNSYMGKGRDYDHLSPVVDFLLGQGLVSNNDFLWGNNRTGYFCHLKGDIDFSLLRDNFEFPDSIVLNEDLQTIDCQITYSLIKGGF